MIKKFGFCLRCKAEQNITSTNQLQEILAAEIGSLVERHHLGVTKIMIS